MSNQRYSPEFKDEAVRQVLDRGYSVAEVSERLGVSPVCQSEAQFSVTAGSIFGAIQQRDLLRYFELLDESTRAHALIGFDFLDRSRFHRKAIGFPSSHVPFEKAHLASASHPQTDPGKPCSRPMLAVDNERFALSRRQPVTSGEC